MHMKRIHTVRVVLAYTDHMKPKFWSHCSTGAKLSHLDHGTTYVCVELHNQALNILHTFSLEV